MQRAEAITCFVSSMYNCITSLSFFLLWKKDSECCLMRFNATKTVSSAACATINIVTFCAGNKCPKLYSAILMLLAGIVCVCSLIRCSFKMLNRPVAYFEWFILY